MFSEETSKNLKNSGLVVLSALSIMTIFSSSILFASAPRDEMDYQNEQEEEQIIKMKSKRNKKIWTTAKNKSILREVKQTIEKTNEIIDRYKEESETIEKELEIKAFEEEMKQINRQVDDIILEKKIKKDNFEEGIEEINRQVDDAKLVIQLSRLEIQVMNKELDLINLNDNSKKSKICSEIANIYVELAKLHSVRYYEYTKLSQLYDVLAKKYSDLDNAKDEVEKCECNDMIDKIIDKKNELRKKISIPN